MKKIIIIILGIFLAFILIIFLIIKGVESTPMHKDHQNFIENFDLELKGEIIEIKSDTSLRIACLRVEESNYKDYNQIDNNRFFIRVKDSLAVMIYSVKDLRRPRHHQYKIGSKLVINLDNNKKIIEIDNGDTIDVHSIRKFPVRDYLKNSCIPD
ncbi:hypothetical protein [Moheibacter sediminis]|uniref:Uncharacterized protein n=1 Tax=Moheibacter sediminis TaxID=1434700 RepID=A0A1W2BBE4_9FLAO|nr:hypothetical protein [Moheibacter sediminis]SMC70307.1 hypothetical protein SAMN06296427_10631 [Moheibacter sediminis]